VWWSGRIYGMKKPTRKTKTPTYLVDVIYAGSETKTMGLKLTLKTYGPAQCKIADVRFGGENRADSYTRTAWSFSSLSRLPMAGS